MTQLPYRIHSAAVTKWVVDKQITNTLLVLMSTSNSPLLRNWLEETLLFWSHSESFLLYPGFHSITLYSFETGLEWLVFLSHVCKNSMIWFSAYLPYWSLHCLIVFVFLLFKLFLFPFCHCTAPHEFWKTTFFSNACSVQCRLSFL